MASANKELSELLFKELNDAANSVRGDNLSLEVLIENLVSGKDFENKLAKLTNAHSTLRKAVATIKSTKKIRADLLKMFASATTPPALPARGALSDDQIWERLGWKDIGGARSIWTRPANAKGITEHFPPQISRFIAQYAENEEAMAKATAIDQDSPMLPVTMEQAKEFRRQDAMWDRIDKARNRMMFDADEKKRQQKENVRAEMMDDYSRFIHENTDRYGKTGAETVFRQKLLKELPPFLKNTNLSTKTLISIDKAIKSARGIPLIGKLMHPATLGLAALGIADAVLSTSNASNKTVAAWSASRALTGSPSRRFDDMARLAGAKDEQEVLKMYGSLLEKFGTEDAFEMMGHALRSAPPGIQRLSVARSLGIDEKQASALMYLAGGAPLESTSEAQSTAAKYSQLEDIESWGFRSGSSLEEKARSASLWLPMEKSLEARGTSWFDILDKGVTISTTAEHISNPLLWYKFFMRKGSGFPANDVNETINDIDEAIRRNMESTNAAESLDEAERQGDTTMNSNVRNSAIYITNMNVQTNDPKAFSEALDGMANGDNRGLLATSGNYVLA